MHNIQKYDIEDHYWIVGGDTSQVFSSKRMIYVPLDDSAYATFLSFGSIPTVIDSHASLTQVVNQPIYEHLAKHDIKSVRAIREGDAVLIAQREQEALAIRATLLT